MNIPAKTSFFYISQNLLQKTAIQLRRSCLLVAVSMSFCSGTPCWADTKSSAPRPADDPYHGETAQGRDARMAWWREARFGMFIHWGIYSVPAGSYQGQLRGGPGEWIMRDQKIPVAEYAAYAKDFNPTKFDAEEWVRLAKDAGMKYIVITAKHHDGFAMFDSKAGNFNIVHNTPFKRDPLKELAAACRKSGIKLGFYYSQNQDWHQPGGACADGTWDQAQEGNIEDYLATVAVPQIKELMTNYGPDTPAILWWDTPLKNFTPKNGSLFQPLLALHPGIITNNRLNAAAPFGQGYPGDTETPEQHIPTKGHPGLDWETCMTINRTWGYKVNDTDWKSKEALLRNLVDIASKGGNYLLNVGPTAEGMIPEPEIDRLKAIGAWLKVNGEAIYGTRKNPFNTAFSWGCVTQKGQRIYLSVFDWPEDGKLVLPMHNSISKAYLLTKPGEALSFSTSEDGVVLQLPAAPVGSIASVIAVDIPDAIAPLPAPSLTQQPDGSITLLAADATIESKINGERELRLQGKQIPNLGYWLKKEDFAVWNALIKKPGEFEMSVEYSAARSDKGIGLTVSVGQASVQGALPATGGWDIYQTGKLGKLKIDEKGVVSITIKRETDACNLRSISVRPLSDSTVLP